jgi:hypothetical protein
MHLKAEALRLETNRLTRRTRSLEKKVQSERDNALLTAKHGPHSLLCDP